MDSAHARAIEIAEDSPVGAPRPTLSDTAHFFGGPLGIRSIALTGLFVLACFYTLYFARDFFLPVMLAIVVNFLFAPLVRVLKRLRIPQGIGAALVIVAVVSLVGSLMYELSGPLADWVEKVPQTGALLQSKMQPFHRYFDKINSTTEQIEKLGRPKTETARAPQRVELTPPSLLGTVFTGTSKFVFSMLVVVVLLYFLLASGDLFLLKMVHVLPTLSDKKKAVQIAHEIESNISKYLVTISVINAGIGVVSGILFWALGLPSPALWGATAALLNFIPTVGALGMAVLITLVSITTSPSIAQALLAPVGFLAVTVATGTFISPMIMGRRLTLNPVVIFLGLSFWGWLWGIPGALLAVPMLSMFKIFCDHIKPLAPIGEFLGH